jgi:uncharacterized membrane protein
MRTKTLIAQFIVTLLPVIYLLSIWNTLPESVPLHYNSALVADRYGSKGQMAGVLLFLSVVSVLCSVLVLNINRIDPKQRNRPLSSSNFRISWALTIFMTLISAWIVYYTSNYPNKGNSNFSLKHLVALVALLYVAMGNYMNNIKPNFFIGIRTPWTLSDDDIWRKTHRLGSRVWFYGGCLMFALAILLPVRYANYIMIAGTLVLAIIPIAYSYKLFIDKQKRSL